MKQAQTIFITGAACGIGRATARLFAQRGWFVGATDIAQEGLQALQQELPADRCATWTLDVTDQPRFNEVMKQFGELTGGRLDLMFNNAGICSAGSYVDVPREAYRQMLSVNFEGVMNGIDAAFPLLKTTPGSLLLTTSSSAAIYGLPGLAVYAATKCAVVGLTEALAIEFKDHDIRVADLLPGFIHTGFHKAMLLYVGGKAVGNVAAFASNAAAKKEGRNRLVEPEEVAEVVWRAYREDKIHWYVPQELEPLVALKAKSVEEYRELTHRGQLN